MLKISSPLIIPIREFNSFEDYFKSLTKSCRNSLTLPKQKRLMDGLQYRELGWDEDVVRYYMNLWEQQSIHFGTPKWPDGWLEHMKDLNSRGNFNMFGMIKGNEIISVHFVFVFNDYIYCNSPLYDKDKYDKISLGRLMWYSLIKFSIESTNWNFLDLDGNNNGTTYREVIENRVPPGTPGDFGYKWFFIPEKIKNLDEDYIEYYGYRTDVVNNDTWKGLTIDPHYVDLGNNWVDDFDELIEDEIPRQYTGEFEVEDGDIVVDLGASTGLFSIEASKNASIVYAVEPFPEMLEVLRPRVKDISNIVVDDIAIGTGNRETFEVVGAVKGERTYVNESQTFMDFVKKHNIEKIDYLKIDIENAEYYIFSDLDRDDYQQRLDWIKKNVKKIIIEVDSKLDNYAGVNNEIHSNKEARHFIDYVIPYLGGKVWGNFCFGGRISEYGTNRIGTAGKDIVVEGGWRNSEEFTKYMNQFLMYIDLREDEKEHNFYIRNYTRIEELHLLLKQLRDVGIKNRQIKLLTSNEVEDDNNTLQGFYDVHRIDNSGYMQGDADLIQKSLELSNQNNINHYLNAGMVIYDKKQFKKYLRMTENSDDIIHIALGNDLIENDYNSNLGSTNLNELATGMIITATKDGIGILKNCYHKSYLTHRQVDLEETPVHISYYQKYISHNGDGKGFLKLFPEENPFIPDSDINSSGAPMYIEYYFYQKVWEQTNFRLVNLTDNYRGIHLKEDSEKKTRDWLLNRDAGVIRLSKYSDMNDVSDTMLNIIKEDTFYDNIGFYEETQMETGYIKEENKNLLLVAHMDDETIFFGNWLYLNGKDTKVIVTCEPSTNTEKLDSFKKVMEYCKVSDYEMWEWKESLNGYSDLERLKNKVKDEVEINNYNVIVTHNSMGEYAHIQHQQLNEIMTECLYENIISNFWVYDLHPLGLEYRGYDLKPKEEMMELYPEQERVHTIENMRRCESTWYDHCKPAKWGSKYVGGGNLIDYESIKMIDGIHQQKINIGIVRDEPRLNNDYSTKFEGEIVTSKKEEEKLDDVYSSPVNDFLKTISSYYQDHNVEWVDILDDYDDFVGLTNESKQMYVTATIKTAMICHKLGLPYMFIGTFSEDIPKEIKSSASRIIYPSHHHFDQGSMMNETAIDFSRHHHVVKYDLLGQLHRAVISYKRHNIKSISDVFSFFLIEDNTNPDSLGKMHLRLRHPENEGFYFVEGITGNGNSVITNWKLNLSTSSTIWLRAELTEKVVDQEGMILRFWKDPIEVSNGDGMHPEPHEHNYLPDWKTKKVRYPDFTIIIPKGYECKEWQ